MLKTWIMAARPKSLGSAVAPVLIGTAMAYGDALPVHWPSFACALIGALLIQIGTNLANDYFDFVKGADTAERVGPTRATQAGLVPPRTMERAYQLCFAAALLPGAYIIFRGGWPFLVVGTLSILFGILYTGGPRPLGYLGLGDVLVLIFFGPVAVAGTYYLHALEVTPQAIVAGIAPGLISVALLTVNNLRDVDQDRVAGKRTLAVRFGRTFARAEYVVCLVVATILVPLYFYYRTDNVLFIAAGMLGFAFAAPAVRAVLRSAEGAALGPVFGRTGKLLFLFSIMLSLSWLV